MMSRNVPHFKLLKTFLFWLMSSSMILIFFLPIYNYVYLFKILIFISLSYFLNVYRIYFLVQYRRNEWKMCLYLFSTTIYSEIKITALGTVEKALTALYIDIKKPFNTLYRHMCISYREQFCNNVWLMWLFLFLFFWMKSTFFYDEDENKIK